MESLSDLPALKAGTFEAGIFIFSPLCGFLPALAFSRDRVLRVSARHPADQRPGETANGGALPYRLIARKMFAYPKGYVLSATLWITHDLSR